MGNSSDLTVPIKHSGCPKHPWTAVWQTGCIMLEFIQAGIQTSFGRLEQALDSLESLDFPIQFIIQWNLGNRDTPKQTTSPSLIWTPSGGPNGLI